VRVAIIAECFLPEVNGVTNSVLRVLEHLDRTGHQAMVIAPGAGRGRPRRPVTGPSNYLSTPVERVPGISLPLYRSLSVGVPTGQVLNLLEGFSPDIIHLAAPTVLGAAGVRAARLLGVPTVAIYQTDLAGFARRYGCSAAAPALWAWLSWVHRQADLTLAPSTPAAWELRHHGVTRVACWARGVDTERFHPGHRSALLRRRLAPNGEVVVGYVGRLAREKQVHLLAHLRGIPGARVVVVGDGPARAQLEQQLPGVRFLGFLTGPALSQALASLDVFVHTGVDETFCQAIQEALSSGVPVVAPASGGPLDLVHPGVNGWLYPPNKAELLRGAVETLVKDSELRATMSVEARRSVEGRTWSVLGDQLLDHYRGLIEREAARGGHFGGLGAVGTITSIRGTRVGRAVAARHLSAPGAPGARGARGAARRPRLVA
jgi:phosphatidylinositol alpha 1,6-mannosyltransferase